MGDKSKKLNFEQRMQLVYATIRQHGDAAGQLNGELNGGIRGGLNDGQMSEL